MNGSLVIVSAILLIWFGVLIYLISLDRKVARLSRKVGRDEQKN